jgi:hypothetical protein
MSPEEEERVMSSDFPEQTIHFVVFQWKHFHGETLAEGVSWPLSIIMQEPSSR